MKAVKMEMEKEDNNVQREVIQELREIRVLVNHL